MQKGRHCFFFPYFIPVLSRVCVTQESWSWYNAPPPSSLPHILFFFREFRPRGRKKGNLGSLSLPLFLIPLPPPFFAVFCAHQIYIGPIDQRNPAIIFGGRRRRRERENVLLVPPAAAEERGAKKRVLLLLRRSILSVWHRFPASSSSFSSSSSSSSSSRNKKLRNGIGLGGRKEGKIRQNAWGQTVQTMMQKDVPFEKFLSKLFFAKVNDF